MSPSDEAIARILIETRTIAMLGASTRPDRPSFRVGAYLAAQGYRVIPVNPDYAGHRLHGETVRATVAEIDAPVDLVDIFRKPEAIPDMVRASLSAFPGLRTVWMQMGLSSPEGRALAEARGVAVVENRCMMAEHKRLIARR